MVGMVEIKAAYDSAKAAFQIAEGYSALKTEAAKNAAVIEVQHKVVEAQRGLSAALDHISDLEKEIVRLKDWSRDKERYDLTAVGERAVVYAEKPDVEQPKAPHWLCQQCFDDTHRSALQFRDVVQPMGGLGMLAVWFCNRCRTEIRTGRNATPANPGEH